MKRRIRFDRFEGGLDVRKASVVSDANRLMTLENAYVTTGMAIRSRPGLVKVADIPSGTVGLAAYNGVLQVYSADVVTTGNPLIESNRIIHPSGGIAVTEIHFAQPFQGFQYVAAEYADGNVFHHYLDGSAITWVDQAPQSRAVAITGSKVWAGDGDVVRFSATLDARDWTTVQDAGFLPVGSNRRGAPDVTALGPFYQYLAVLFEDGLQLWSVDPDPTLHALYANIDSGGTAYHQSVRTAFSDLFYLADGGYRSVAIQGFNRSEEETDIGSPIDPIVLADLAAFGGAPLGVYYGGGGQYWSILGDTVHVYSFSRSAKISAWSVYRLGITVDAAAEMDSTLYLRSGDSIYRVDDAATDDDGVAFAPTIRLPYLDFKEAGTRKYITAMDASVQGAFDLSMYWDPNDEAKKTQPIRLTGVTAEGALTPVELTVSMLSPEFVGAGAGPWQLDAFQFYWNKRTVR